jgi:hypothetical protein
MPSDVSPRIFRFSMTNPPGSAEPTAAKGYFPPATTLVAPQTTLRLWLVPSFTVQT